MKHRRTATTAPPLRRGLVAVALAALTAIAMAIVPTVASAAQANGSVDFDIVKRSKAGKGLIKAKIKAQKPAATASDRKGTLLGFVVRNAEAGPKFSSTLKGSIVVKNKKRKAKITQLSLASRSGKTTVTGKLGKRKLTIFTANRSVKETVDGATTTYAIAGAKLTLPKPTAKQLNKKLKLKKKAKIKQGATGKLFVDVAIEGEEPPPPPPDPDYPYAEQCDVQTGTPLSTPTEVEAPQQAPSFEVDQPVTGTSIDWGFKDSFRSYVLSHGSLPALDGATAVPNGESMAVQGSYWRFSASSGSYEAGNQPDHSDDKLVINGTGTVIFCSPDPPYLFAVVMKDPTITIDGEDSRITASIGVNQGGTWYPFQRTDIAQLDLADIEPDVTDNGNSIGWDNIPVSLGQNFIDASGTEDFYDAGDQIDSISVEATIDRPLLTECPIASQIDGPPTIDPPVDFTKLALPELDDPIVAEGDSLGTINWGFRSGSRGGITSAMSGGASFVLLGGATASNPFPSMSGAGKFFRFPITEYAYDEGTSDPTDDVLIASSDATIAFCNANPGRGNWATVISKPTLVIDGTSSRVVANSYSFKGEGEAPAVGPAEGWAGGRVDIVALDASSVDAVADDGTVTWGDVVGDEVALENGIPATGAYLTNAFRLAGPSAAIDTGAGAFDPVAAQIDLPTP